MMKLIDQGQDTERIEATCKIYGEYKGVKFEAVYDNYFWTHKNNDPSTYWWREGNMCCDCNRVQFLPNELYGQHSGECGHSIRIHKIVPLEGDLPTLIVDDYEE